QTFAFYAELHLVLYRQALIAQVDETYALLAAHAGTPERLVDPACIQIGSLSTRTDYVGGVRLGAELLASLGVEVPLDDPLSTLERELALLYEQAQANPDDFLPDRMAEPNARLVARAKLMNSVASTASHYQPLITGWVLVREALEWNESGCLENYISMVPGLIMTTIALRGDHVLGYRAARRALEMGLAHERGAETALAQHICAAFVNHWFHPLEEDMELGRRAYDGMMRVGDLDYASVTFVNNLTVTLECGATLSQMHPECDPALTFVRKTGDLHAEQIYVPYQQFTRALEGLTAAPGCFDDDDFKEQEFLSAAANNPQALCIFHVLRGLAAAILADEGALNQHVEMALRLTPTILGTYVSAQLNFLHSLALIQQIRAADAEDERAGLLKRLETNLAWLAARAADAPVNFGHLSDQIQAERLDVLEQPWEALGLYEQAMRKAQGNQRPWHQALITERAGQFYLRQGLEYAGQQLLVRAHHLYKRWGASAKTQAMQQSMPFLVGGQPGTSSNSRDDDLNYEVLLRATQVLASETSQPRLVARVVEILGQLTGATDTRLLLLDDHNQWQLEGGMQGSESLERMSLVEAKERRIVAASVLQLCLKTFKPVVSDDALIDQRFAGDPHFADLPLCSLLALPVLVRGRVSAVLTLENRLTRAAFRESRVETVSMLCKQLAISIENVRLYQSLERKVAERTAELSEVNDKLQQLSELDGLTGVANRRKFDSTLDKEWRRALRGGHSLAVLMVDIDHFKMYNDQYGHQAGDQCLKQVAGILASTAKRPGDLVARYGGEEFVAILPGLDRQAASEVAEKMRKAIETQRIEHIRNTPLHLVTISLGVGACVPKEFEPMRGLVEQADACLYRAKNTGRNRVG
ncbi:MAG: diguanylate cyclase, partial [Chloroflexota bacterium]